MPRNVFGTCTSKKSLEDLQENSKCLQESFCKSLKLSNLCFWRFTRKRQSLQEDVHKNHKTMNKQRLS